MLRLAKMYLHGQGCQRSAGMAQEWLRKARYLGVGGSLEELYATEVGVDVDGWCVVFDVCTLRWAGGGTSRQLELAAAGTVATASPGSDQHPAHRPTLAKTTARPRQDPEPRIKLRKLLANEERRRAARRAVGGGGTLAAEQKGSAAAGG
jgi:hypothetical protein